MDGLGIGGGAMSLGNSVMNSKIDGEANESIKLEIKAADVLDSKADNSGLEVFKLELVEVKCSIQDLYEQKVDLKTDVDLKESKDGLTKGDYETAEGKPNALSCAKIEDDDIDKPKIDLVPEMYAQDSKTNMIPSKNKVDEADVKLGNVGEVPNDNPAEAGGNSAKIRRFKKRKMPPPFIGPQRPIQEEDLEDIMNGVYDIPIGSFDTDEELPALSSSNESCNSSDPEGWLVDSSDDSDGAEECGKSSAYAEKLAVVRTRLQEALASKARLDQTTNFVGTESNLASLDASVRATLAFADPHLQAGLDALTALSNAPMAKLTLLKHTHLLETALRLCKYVPSQPARSGRGRSRSEENAHKICNDASHIINNIMTLFEAKDRKEFWNVFLEQVEEFEKKTEQMTIKEKYSLTEDPPARESSVCGTRTYATMMIDNVREEEQFADDESQSEPVPENVLKKPRFSKRSRGKENRDSSSKVCLEKAKKHAKNSATPRVGRAIGSLVSMEVEDCEDLLVDSDASAPFSEDDIASSLGAIDSQTTGASLGFQASLQSDSGIFSGSSLRELRSQQTISLTSELHVSDAQLLQSSDSD